jgi:hypothetical protein
MGKGDLSNMKLRLAAMACLVLSAYVASVSAQSSDWKEYVYADDGFAVSFPSEPTLTKSMIPLKIGGEAEMHQYLVDAGGGYSFLADVGYAPSGDVYSLTAARDGMVNAVKGKLVSEMPISLGNYPGLQVEIEAQGFHVRARLYIVGERRLYELISGADSDKPISLDTTRFFASFRLLGASAVSR